MSSYPCVRSVHCLLVSFVQERAPKAYGSIDQKMTNMDTSAVKFRLGGQNR